MTKLRALVVRFEKTKLAAQLFRVVRLAVPGLLAAYLSGSAIDTAAVVAAVEVAFRQVFPT